MSGKNKKPICSRISILVELINSLDVLTEEQRERISDELWSIKVSAQHMENRMYKYSKSIELLGFKRDRRIKAKLYNKE